MASVICVHLSQLVNFMSHRHAPHNFIEHTHAKTLVSALERQCHGVTLTVRLLIIIVT